MRTLVALMVLIYFSIGSAFALDSTYKWRGYMPDGSYMRGSMRHEYGNRFKIKGYDSNGNYYWGTAKQGYGNPNKFKATLYTNDGRLMYLNIKVKD